MQVLVNDQKLPSGTPKDEVKRKLVTEIQDLLKRVELSGDNNTNKNNNNNSNKSGLQLPQEPQATTEITQSATAISTLRAHTPFPGISQLLPSLYLCGAGVAMPQILDQLGVTFIVNVAPELPDTPLSSETRPLYWRVDALDRPQVELSEHFDEVADMIEQVRQSGGISLVHCVAGVSRSTTLCLAYLMKYADMSLRAAYQHVKALRPQIRPNSGFFQQLRRYEEQVRGACSVQMVFYESLNKEIPDVYEPEFRAMEEFYQRQRQRNKALKQR